MSYISKKRLWLTADGARVVEEGDPAAAFLLVGEGGTVSDEDAKRYNLTALEPAPAPWDAKAEHERLHAGETQEEADAKRAALFEKAVDKPPANKAVGKAPSNKANAPEATDAAREKAAEEGVDLSEVEGTGKDGRITLADVEKAAGE